MRKGIVWTFLETWVRFACWHARRGLAGVVQKKSAPAIWRGDQTQVFIDGRYRPDVTLVSMDVNLDTEMYDALILPSGGRADSPATDGSPAVPDSRSQLKMDHSILGEGAARQLDTIQKGGHHLVLITRQRIWDALDALDEGDFVKVLDLLSHAKGYVGSLAQAQQFIAVADGAKMIHAADLAIGMTITDVGEVSDVEVEECPSPQCRRHIKVKVGEHDFQFHGDQEVFVDE